MPGTDGFGMWFAYIGMSVFFLLVLVMFLRLVVMLSLLWLSPLAAVFRNVPGLRFLLPKSIREAVMAPRERQSNPSDASAT